MTYEHPGPQRFHDAPAYWRRHYSTDGVPEEQIIGGMAVITPQMPEGGIVIYGYSTRSDFAEDQSVEEQTWRDRLAFPAVCFSVICPQGEFGHVHVGDVTAISQQEFEAARERGWQKGDQ